jgi:hypothetical protein
LKVFTKNTTLKKERTQPEIYIVSRAAQAIAHGAQIPELWGICHPEFYFVHPIPALRKQRRFFDAQTSFVYCRRRIFRSKIFSQRDLTRCLPRQTIQLLLKTSTQIVKNSLGRHYTKIQPGICLIQLTKISFMMNILKSVVLVLLLAVGLSSCVCYGPRWGYGYRGGYHHHYHHGGHYRR